MGASDDVLESVLGLGDLADLTVTNDETDYNYDVKTGAPCRLKQLTLPFNGHQQFSPLPSLSDLFQQGVFFPEDVESQVHAEKPL